MFLHKTSFGRKASLPPGAVSAEVHDGAVTDVTHCCDLPIGGLALWNDADLDIPILKEAQGEYAKLQ